MERRDLLLEIGCEEIPASYIAPAVAQLADRLGARLSQSGIEFDGSATQTFCTPRRLVVRLREVATREPLREEQRLGPAVAAAFAADGTPTKAAEGFARSCGVAVENLERVPGDKGERLAATVQSGGRETRELLLAPDFLRELLQLDFPKSMRWIPGDDFRFARPIRWLLCLFGQEPLPLRLAHLTAGAESRGHRTLNPESFAIAEPGRYEAALRERSVEVDPARRRAEILAQGRAEAEKLGGQLHEDDELLDELAQLVEHPQVLVGRFEAELVDVLPPEVIITAMRAHQRYCSVLGRDGKLLPVFLAFRDGGEEGLEHVVAGNERVLRARLADARFYWDEDRSQSSEAKLEQLARIVWLEGYGSIAEKCERIRDLAVALADEWRLDLDRAQLGRAALLCKSDLATEMIRDGKEFTKLQGRIGRAYALEAGESPDVADAIAEHLYPRFAGDRLPEGSLGELVALADRLDSLAGCARAGFLPKGGADPYAMRRQALAVLRMLVERERHLDLSAWLQRALAAFPEGDTELRAQLERLLWGRLESLLSDLPAELLRAVLSVFPLDPCEIARFARALAGFAGGADFAALHEGAKRCRNILLKEGRLAEEGGSESERLGRLQSLARERFENWRSGEGLRHRREELGEIGEPAEAALAEAAHATAGKLATALEAADPTAIYGALAGLGKPISRFFDEVLVNDPDAAIRERRLGFLEDLHYLFARFADLSQMSALSASAAAS